MLGYEDVKRELDKFKMEKEDVTRMFLQEQSDIDIEQRA